MANVNEAVEGDSLAQVLEDDNQTGMVATSEASETETRCPICLGNCEDKAFIDACFHAYCFTCIVQWAEVTNSCPMCKTSFNTVIHNVKANDDYDQYTTKSNPTPSHQEVSLSEARRIFRYRTTQRPGGQGPSGRQRYQSNIRASRKPAAEQRRRAVYSTGLRPLPLESEGKRPRVRNISAEFFRENPASMHRLFPWLSREFKVLLGEEHVEFMIQIIVTLIDKVDLESEEFAHHLEPYLHSRTSHFMDEFTSFAQSPYDMIAYDNRVRYDWPANRAPPAAPRDTWDPEDNAQNVAGPSSAVNIQQRILEEITSARWDDSPPLMPSDSPTPIVIHDSDSDPALSPIHTSLSPVHTNQSQHHSSKSPVHRSGKGRLNPDYQEAQPSSAGDSCTIIRSTEISSTTEPVCSDVTCTTTELVPASSMAVAGTTEAALVEQTGSVRSDPEALEDSYAISIYAESTEDMELESSSERKKSKGKEKERADDRSRSHSDRNREDDRRRRHKRYTSTSSSSDDEHAQKSRRKRKHKSYRNHREHCEHGSYRRDCGYYRKDDEYRRYRRHREDERSRHERRRSPIGGYRGDHDYERDSYTASGSYFQRETHCHRTRLYSDDCHSPVRSIPSAVTVVFQGKKDEQKSSGHPGLESGRGESESRQGVTSHRRHHTKREASEHHVVARAVKEEDRHLGEELSELEEQIREDKRRLLKSMLYRERLDLLHKKLHGSGSSQPEDIRLKDVRPAKITEATPISDMLKELESVDQAIKDGKRQVLRVMKRIEEQHAEEEIDSN